MMTIAAAVETAGLSRRRSRVRVPSVPLNPLRIRMFLAWETAGFLSIPRSSRREPPAGARSKAVIAGNPRTREGRPNEPEVDLLLTPRRADRLVSDLKRPRHLGDRLSPPRPSGALPDRTPPDAPSVPYDPSRGRPSRDTGPYGAGATAIGRTSTGGCTL
jgi:hypothetical protein